MPAKVKILAVLLLCWLVVVCLTRQNSSPVTATTNSFTPVSAAKHKKIGKTDCKECHGGLLKQKELHPVAEECAGCHEYTETKDAAEVKLTSAPPELCLTCHSDKQEDFEKKKFKHAAAEADCTLCHNPHSTDEPALLKDKANQLCFMCHTDKQDEINEKPFTHAPAKDVGCSTCHNPHTADFPTLLRVNVNGLCLACHGMTAAKKPDKTVLVVFSHRSMPEKYADKAKKIFLGRDGKGHPYMGHPVSDVPDPSNPKQMMTCLSCHNPHAGKVVQMFKGDVSKQALCDKCHK